jgi:predicted Holliday junction resolvase-like endonuclease
MFEALFGIIVALLAAVLALFKRNSTLKGKVATEKQKASTATQAANHNAKIASVIVERGSAQEKVIKERIDESVSNDFSDFYGDDK